jgi:hypothetical protein
MSEKEIDEGALRGDATSCGIGGGRCFLASSSHEGLHVSVGMQKAGAF